MDYSELVKKLIKQGYLKTPAIIEAFQRVKRADFLPAGLKNEAGVDAPLPIGYGQTNSQPLTVAFMLELLQPQPGDRILDIGSGSGWTSALLARCVLNGKVFRQSQGKVFAIERIAELAEFGKNNISRYNFIKQGIVKLVYADGSQGLTAEAPFDKILVSAATEKIPTALKEQLKVGGRLVIPAQNSIWSVEKKGKNDFREQEFYGFSFVPLIRG